MKWHAPVDPNCPKVKKFIGDLFSDPMTSAYGAPVDDIIKGFENKHRIECKHCQSYGAENIEVI